MSSLSKRYTKPTHEALRLYEKSRTFALEKCENCQFIMTNTRPVEERLGEYYGFDNYISHSDTKEGFVSKCYHIVRKWNIKHKTNQLGEKKGKLVEIGSGTGKLLAKCKEVGWDVKGIEPSAEARRIAKETNGIELLKI